MRLSEPERRQYLTRRDKKCWRMEKSSNIKSAIIFCICTGVVLALAAFIKSEDKKAWYLQGHAQGTTYSITYYAKDSIVTIGQMDSILSQIDSSLSLYEPYSLINRFNASESGVS